MALKQPSRTRVIVELPSELQGKRLNRDELKDNLYAVVAEALKGLNTDIDIEIDDQIDTPTPLERIRAGLEDIKAGRAVKFETAEDLLRDE
jgi:hypothetical protein